MAITHTKLPSNEPGHRTEHSLAKHLANCDDEKLHLWFGVDYLPAVSDIDILIWHEDVGAFIVEVKGVELSDISEFGLSKCVIGGREDHKTPQKQALSAMHRLKEYCGSKQQLPFMVPTVCWPRITRANWRQRWNTVREVVELGDSFLFREDLESGSEILRRRLNQIRNNPPIGLPPGQIYSHRPEQLERVERLLSPTARPSPTPSDLERLKRIEGAVASQVRKTYPTTETHRVIFRGHPGTGKTFRLLQLGVHFQQAGQNVLFVCFNKVLATDIRRLLSYSESVRSARGRLEVADIYDLLRPHGAQYGITISEDNDPDEWAGLVIDALGKDRAGTAHVYDTVLMDEAQDLPAWSLDFLRMFMAPKASLFVADGPGQELYGEAPPFLAALRNEVKPVQLNRCFRNTKPAFMVAQTYYEIAPRVDRLLQHLDSRFRSNDQRELGFDRESGRPPRLVSIDDSAVWSIDQHSAGFADLQREVMVPEIQRIVKNELDELNDEQHPMDVLLLVPQSKSVWTQWVRDALNGLSVPFIDYVDNERRRDVARGNQLRLCTFHSARGIEAHRVVIFNFANIERIAEATEANHKHLGYIVLSRSLFETCVVLDTYKTPASEFLKRTVTEVIIREEKA